MWSSRPKLSVERIKRNFSRYGSPFDPILTSSYALVLLQKQDEDLEISKTEFININF